MDTAQSYNPNETVTLSLERYTDLLAKTEKRQTEEAHLYMCINKLRELGYVSIYNSDKIEIMKEEEYNKTQTT